MSYQVSLEVAARFPYVLPPAPAKGPRPIRHDTNGMEVVLVTTPYTGPSKRTQKRRASRTHGSRTRRTEKLSEKK